MNSMNNIPNVQNEWSHANENATSKCVWWGFCWIQVWFYLGLGQQRAIHSLSIHLLHWNNENLEYLKFWLSTDDTESSEFNWQTIDLSDAKFKIKFHIFSRILYCVKSSTFLDDFRLQIKLCCSHTTKVKWNEGNRKRNMENKTQTFSIQWPAAF